MGYKTPQEQRLYDAVKAATRKQAGLCTGCGALRDDPSFLTCSTCRARARLFGREYYYKYVRNPNAINNSAKTHCLRGHPLPPPKNGHRVCQLCKNIRKREWRAARRQAATTAEER